MAVGHLPPLQVRSMDDGRLHPVTQEQMRDITALVSEFGEDQRNELEVRIGSQSGGNFVPGVTSAFSDTAQRLLQKSVHLHSTVWDESHTAFYTYNGTPYRTEVMYNADSLMVEMQTVEKRKIRSIDVLLSDNVCIRFALACEIETTAPPAAVTTTHWRIKQRSSHTYMGTSTLPYMVYDVTRSWSARNKTDAEVQQMDPTQHPVHEVEIELKHNTEYGDAVRIGKSLVLKTLDIINKCQPDTIVQEALPEPWECTEMGSQLV